MEVRNGWPSGNLSAEEGVNQSAGAGPRKSNNIILCRLGPSDNFAVAGFDGKGG